MKNSADFKCPHVVAERVRSDLTNAIRAGTIDLERGSKRQIEAFILASIEAGFAVHRSYEEQPRTLATQE